MHMHLMQQPFVPAAAAAPFPEAFNEASGAKAPLNVLRDRAAQSAAAAKAAAAVAKADADELDKAEKEDEEAKRCEYFAWMRERESMRYSMRCGGTMLM